ncbi:RDD family protein [Jannaschia pohangensis]|uniref:RDD family protein n=1 Tax=Jannaschia pohangensis TaxID=390807 RepID=A0A1I3GLY8_9RHOB|nr:RDD family protein [Jannaschia pohangensis]SFI24430.1 RDD family protein [Jannaschia pohangensis]
MTYAISTTSLPDPVDEAEFYRGILSKRFLAWVVDVALITFFTILAGIFTLTLAFFLWPIVFVAIGFVYRTATLSNRSATWGMRLMGIEFRGHDGFRFDTRDAVLHVAGYYASMVFILPMLASVVAMFATGRRQSLTDLVLGTAAINRPADL